MKESDYEKKTAKELLNLVEIYLKSEDKKETAKKLNKLSEEAYYKKRELLSQKMIDVTLAIHSFTTAGLSGGHFQDLEEFVPDLREVIGG